MTYKRILVPVDGNTTSIQGLKEGVRIARESAANLLLLHVVDQHVIVAHGGRLPKSTYTLMRKQSAATLRDADALARRLGIVPQTVLVETLTGPTSEIIVQQAKKLRADLVVIGTHGRRGLKRLLLGSDAEDVVRLSPVPVLTVRPKARR